MARRLQPSIAGAADDRHAVDRGRITFLLAWRAAGSLLAALVAVAIHIALDPRHYNYPKLVLYAAAIALAWAYVDRPTRPRLAALGAIVGVGFLFRHDHLLYLGALGLHDDRVRASRLDSRRTARAARLCTAAALFVVPFLVFLALNGGIGGVLPSGIDIRAARRPAHELFVSASFLRFFETAAGD